MSDNDLKKEPIVTDEVSSESMLKSLLNKQLQNTKRSLDIVKGEIIHLLRQYAELAVIHELPYLNEPGFGTFPALIRWQDEKARDYRRGSIIAGILGFLLTALMCVLSFRFSPVLTFFGSLAFAWLIGGVVFYYMLFLSDAGPRNPKAQKKVTVLIISFGALAFRSAAAFAWLRFADTGAKSYAALTLVGFEIGMFGLVGAFETGHKIFKWSREYHDEYLILRERRDALEDKLAQLHADVLEHDYRLDTLKPSPPPSSSSGQLNDPVREEVGAK